MSNEWFWREFGTMSPEVAAAAASKGLALTEAYANCMDCDDIADCIENSEAVQAALDAFNQAFMNANGFSADFANSGVPGQDVTPLPDSQLNGSLLPTGYACDNPAQDMAIARAVVRELHETLEDFFELVELITSPATLADTVTDSIPVVSLVGDLLAVAKWLAQTLPNVYRAAYTQVAEDTISCAIFCYLQENCELSLNALIEIYLGIDELDPPPELNNPDELFTWAIETIAVVSSVVIVEAGHLLLLYVLRLAGKWGVMLGFNSISTAIKAASTWRDYTYEDLCEDCPTTPVENFWMIYTNFQAEGLREWEIVNGTLTSEGVRANASGNATLNLHIENSGFTGDAWKMAGGAVRLKRVNNGVSNGGNTQMIAYPNYPPTGSDLQTIFSSTDNGAGLDLARAQASLNDLAPYPTLPNNRLRETVRLNCTLTPNAADTTRELCIREVYVWGYEDSSGNKPVNAVWIEQTPDVQGLTVASEVFDGTYEPNP